MSLCDIAAHMPILTEYARHAGFVLELGVGQGDGSTVALVQGLMESRAVNPLMISVDREADGFVRPVAPFWHFVRGDTCSIPTRWGTLIISGERRPDLIFIDTEHTREQMETELRVWSPLAKDSTVWLFHDTWMFGQYNSMTDAIKEYAAENGWRYDDLSKESHGLGRMIAVSAIQKPEYSFVFDKPKDTWVCSIHGEVDYVGWIPCWYGCTDGYFDDYDPIECGPGEISTCPECYGNGGWNVCGQCNADNPDVEW